MQCKLDLIILTKIKEKRSATMNRSDTAVKMLSTPLLIILTHVSVPTKKDHNNHQPSHMLLRD
jgi:hypothetical protein